MMNRKAWEDSAQSFECSLMILRKDKNGWVIGFSVHPDEVPNALLSARLGTRFRAVLFQIGDDEKPVPVEPGRVEGGDEKPVVPTLAPQNCSLLQSEGERAVSLSGKLCRNRDFQKWLSATGIFKSGSPAEFKSGSPAELSTAEALRARLEISSRSELKTDGKARKAFFEMVQQFNREVVEEISVDWDSL